MKNVKQYLSEINFDIDLSDYYQEGQIFDEFNDANEAIKYLQKEDPSLKDFLEIAFELGYDIANLSSEVLATLIYQQQLHEKWNDCSKEIEPYFEAYDEYLQGLEGVEC